MSSLRFRDAAIEDLPVIVEIYNSTVSSRMVTADTDTVSVESREEWFADHNPSRHPLWVVETEAGETVGWVSFQPFYGRPAYDATAEISIYLKESARGKGLGKRILSYAMDFAPSIEINTLLGFIFSHNEPSLKLFLDLGFEKWGELPQIAELDGVERSLTILGKRIVSGF
ncbi:MAG: N-acetyltransferase [Gemmatimonadaceae bacterium]|nr:N-acetyltransferase [Chitinophagaceae bacterium]